MNKEVKKLQYSPNLVEDVILIILKKTDYIGAKIFLSVCHTHHDMWKNKNKEIIKIMNTHVYNLLKQSIHTSPQNYFFTGQDDSREREQLLNEEKLKELNFNSLYDNYINIFSILKKWENVYTDNIYDIISTPGFVYNKLYLTKNKSNTPHSILSQLIEKKQLFIFNLNDRIKGINTICDMLDNAFINKDDFSYRYSLK